MPQPNLRITGIDALVLPEKRQALGQIHAYLRECIMDGRVPPDTRLSQAALAKQLGVSRTPVREVLRMLQEEGLVESAPNQRMRVVGFDAAELDATYGARIVLECLAVAMTIDAFGAPQRRQAKAALTAMRRTAKKRELDAWFAAHTEFHGTLTSGAPDPLCTQLRSLSDRSARYIRIGQQLDPAGWQDLGDAEHEALLNASIEHDEETVVSLTAHHLKRTALMVLTDCAPDYVPTAVPKALAQIHAPHSGEVAARLAVVAGA